MHTHTHTLLNALPGHQAQEHGKLCIERVLANISRPRCHSNATRAPIANPPNSAQLGGSFIDVSRTICTNNFEYSGMFMCTVV